MVPKTHAAQADLELTMIVSPEPAIAGENLIYTITLNNAGPDTATSVTVVDGQVMRPLILPIRFLPAGESRAINFSTFVSCSVTNGTQLSNTATVSSSTVDPNPDNNYATVTSTVSNPPPPILSCGNLSLVVSNDQDQCSAAVGFSFVIPFVIGSGGCPPVSISTAPPSGASFAVGITPVMLMVVYAGGVSNTCAFTVKVMDAEKPIIACLANIVTNAIAPTGAVVSFPVPFASDNCSVASVSCSPASDSTFGIGTTNVTCQAIDNSANTNTCTFTVHVQGVAEQISDLITLVQSMSIVSGIKNSLFVKLRDSLTELNATSQPAACAKLQDFINLCRAQNGKKLTAAQADLLVGEATRIRAVLGC